MTSSGLQALVTVLERDSWTYRTFWEFDYNDTSAVTKQVLKAVFFTNGELRSSQADNNGVLRDDNFVRSKY